jgi:hypothetical protein
MVNGLQFHAVGLAGYGVDELLDSWASLAERLFRIRGLCTTIVGALSRLSMSLVPGFLEVPELFAPA